jgi:hypothetical protein
MPKSFLGERAMVVTLGDKSPAESPNLEFHGRQSQLTCPEGELVQVVVVVTGTVVGVVVVATGLVVVVVGDVVGSVVFWGDVVEVAGEVVVEEAGAMVVVVDVAAAVEVVVGLVGETTSVLAVEAKNPTRAAEDKPEPTRRLWVTRRTRANCRSRC